MATLKWSQLFNTHISSLNTVPKSINAAQLKLRNNMRKLWEEHVAWTRMTIISMIEDLQDQKLVTERLLQNAPNMAALLKPYYGEQAANTFSQLITSHLVIAANLVKAAKEGDLNAATIAEQNWFENADTIAHFLSKINPYWPEKALQHMLYNHLDLTKKEAVARLQKNYAVDIAMYDKIVNQALEMADSLSEGIIKQFPRKF
jgi:hypothetical protein